MWDLDVIYVGTPSGEVVEVSSSCDLFIFSSGADSQHAEGIEVTSEGLPIMSIAELWPDIDKLDEINHGGVSAINIPEVMLREKKSWTSVEKTNKPARCRGKGASLNDAPGPSNVLPKGHGKSSMKRKLRRYCLVPLEQFLHVCEGRLSIGNIHLRPVWV
jgi:hypothetical protein